MKTLLDLFNEITKRGKYVYYLGKCTKYKTFQELIDKADKFFKQYFELGGKNPMITDIPLSDKRYQHVIFVYFLGLHMYKNIPQIRERIDVLKGKFEEYKPNDPKKTERKPCFEYVWFMTSLYHDMFFGIELDETEEEKKNRDEALAYFICEGINIERNLPPVEGNIGVPEAIVNNVKKYNAYKQNNPDRHLPEAPFYDHGIAAGCAHYRFICKQYKQTNGEPITLPKGREVIFSKFNMEVLAPKIAWALIGHNMFKIPKKSTTAELKQYKDMPELVSDTPIVSLREHPLLFLLDLVDTIDPCKSERFDTDKALKRTLDINTENEDGSVDLLIDDWNIKRTKLAWLIPMEAGPENLIIRTIRFHGNGSVTAIFK